MIGFVIGFFIGGLTAACIAMFLVEFHEFRDRPDVYPSGMARHK